MKDKISNIIYWTLIMATIAVIAIGAYDIGRLDGYEMGTNDGYESGYNWGHFKGWKEGYGDGLDFVIGDDDIVFTHNGNVYHVVSEVYKQ